VTRAPEGVTSISAENLRIGAGEGVVEGELDRGRRRAAVFAVKGAKVERGRFAVRPDNRLPNAAVAAKKIVLILEEVKETGFRVGKGGRREGKDDVLLFLRKGVNPCHAWETRPLDGVPENVNVMHRVCREKIGKE